MCLVWKRNRKRSSHLCTVCSKSSYCFHLDRHFSVENCRLPWNQPLVFAFAVLQVVMEIGQRYLYVWRDEAFLVLWGLATAMFLIPCWRTTESWFNTDGWENAHTESHSCFVPSLAFLCHQVFAIQVSEDFVRTSLIHKKRWSMSGIMWSTGIELKIGSLLQPYDSISRLDDWLQSFLISPIVLAPFSVLVTDHCIPMLYLSAAGHLHHTHE